MNAILIKFIFLMFYILSINAHVSTEATAVWFDDDVSSLNALKSNVSYDILSEDTFPKKVEILLCLLRKHQRDEEELKIQIKDLLTTFHTAQLREGHKTVKDVLNMLNLSSNQTELLEKIVQMMQGDPNKNKNCKRIKVKVKSNEEPEKSAYGTVATEKTTTTDGFIKSNDDKKGYVEGLELNQDQMEGLAKVVVRIINRDTKLLRELSGFAHTVKFTLPDGDTPPFEPTSEKRSLF